MVDFGLLLSEGCKVKVVSVEHLAEMQTEIMQRCNNGEFDEEFAKEYMPRFKFQAPAELDAKSIIIVAMPRPPKPYSAIKEQNASLSCRRLTRLMTRNASASKS